MQMDDVWNAQRRRNCRNDKFPVCACICGNVYMNDVDPPKRLHVNYSKKSPSQHDRRQINIRSPASHKLKINIDTRTFAKLASNGIHHAIDSTLSSFAKGRDDQDVE